MSKLHDQIKTLGPWKVHQISLIDYCYSTTTTNDLYAGKHGIRAFSFCEAFLCGRIFMSIECLKREKYIYSFIYIFERDRKEREV